MGRVSVTGTPKRASAASFGEWHGNDKWGPLFRGILRNSTPTRIQKLPEGPTAPYDLSARV